MSSFNNPHFIFVFDMTNGKKKLAYGASPDDAYENLKLRLNEKEMRVIDRTRVKKITQREMHQYVKDLG